MSTTSGHAKGWGTPEQDKAIERADAELGRILATLDKLKLRDATHVILTADHGGARLTHRPDDPRARFIRWILTGPSSARAST